MSLFDRPFIRRRALVFLILAGLILLAAAVTAVLRARGSGTPSSLELPREPEILYLAPSSLPELWISGVAGESPRRLTDTGGGLYDYAASPDGDWIAYSVRNQQGGYDLWEMDRQSAASMILPCGTDWCISPVYSPDNRRIAYSRRRFSGLAGAEAGAPRLWMYDRETGQTDTLFIDVNIGGADPAWSPDGRYLAFLDGLQLELRVADMQGENDVSLPAAEDSQFSWSPDSRSLLLTRSAVAHDHPYTFLVAVDIAARQEQVWMEDEELDTSVPVWSPQGDRLAVARRVIHDGPGKQIWLLDSGAAPLQQLTDNPQANHAAYQWSPDGTRLVFQRLAFGSSSSLPELLLWDSQDSSTRVLVEDAFQPSWIR